MDLDVDAESHMSKEEEEDCSGKHRTWILYTRTVTINNPRLQ